MADSAPTFLIHKTAAKPLARAFALFALLCVGALQVQEAGHGHWYEQDDSSIQCLVCKNSSGAALPLDVPAQQPLAVVAGATELAVTAFAASQPSPFFARGPPSYS